MKESWSYSKKRRRDAKGRRWHFATRSFYDASIPYEELPYELLFPDDDWTEVGRILFERRKDSPYRNYEALLAKIMSDEEFRKSHPDPDSRKLWAKSWK
jgi:hypothetical protein